MLTLLCARSVISVLVAVVVTVKYIFEIRKNKNSLLAEKYFADMRLTGAKVKMIDELAMRRGNCLLAVPPSYVCGN